jgi:hypothetical protein
MPQLGYTELVSGTRKVDMKADTKADMYWHDRLDQPLKKFHVGRLGPKQRMNRFYKMIALCKKNALAKVCQLCNSLQPTV